MSLLDSLATSASALAAERLRMDVTAENLANAQTTQGANGGPYRRKSVVLQEVGDFGNVLAGAMGGAPGRSDAGASGVQVAAIVEDTAPPRLVYDPGHPDADARGYVQMPNVEPVGEMVDLITEQRSYEANVTAMQTAKAMFSKTLELLR
jgi:flagellar basal-body rod protein FlgC